MKKTDNSICSLLGWRLMNLSTAAGMSTDILRCMFSSVSPVSHCVNIDDRRAIFIRFSPLKDLSAEQLVTGRVHKILTSNLIFWYIEVVCLRVVVGVDGKLSWPCSFRYCCHLICQQSSTLLMQSGDGRSLRYMVARLFTLVMLSSGRMIMS